MAEYFKYLKCLLSIAGESFEDELKHLGFSVTQLNPMEVLSALLHAQKRLGCDFTKEEFKSGTVGLLMLPEDFKPKESVSSIKPFLVTYIFRKISRQLFHNLGINICEITKLQFLQRNMCVQELDT